MQTSSSNMPVRLAGRAGAKVRTAMSASNQMAASRAIWKGLQPAKAEGFHGKRLSVNLLTV